MFVEFSMIFGTFNYFLEIYFRKQFRKHYRAETAAAYQAAMRGGLRPGLAGSWATWPPSRVTQPWLWQAERAGPAAC
jgi:hypothetical protein